MELLDLFTDEKTKSFIDNEFFQHFFLDKYIAK